MASHQSAPVMTTCLFSDPLLSSTVADPPFDTLTMDHPGFILQTLVALEIDLVREGRERYRHRLENAYDVPGDDLYYSWKNMVVKLGGRNGQCPCATACSCSCGGIGFWDCLEKGVSRISQPLGTSPLPSRSPGECSTPIMPPTSPMPTNSVHHLE